MTYIQEPPKGNDPFILADKEQAMPFEDQFTGAKPNRLIDKFAILFEMYDMSKKWIHTNIQNNNILTRILQDRTWSDIAEANYRPLYENNSPELTDAERLDLRKGFEEINRTMLNPTENYAELRIAAKGFRAKQTERILTGDTKKEKELDKIFKGKDKET